jgi:predicted DNA-binding transcriptional regulator AlpA
MRVLSIKETCSRVNLSRTRVWQMAKSGTFPTPISLCERKKGFLENEINDWISDKAKQRKRGSH